jgi:hypothetical protein
MKLTPLSLMLATGLLAGSAHAIELTDLPGVTASASYCYLGCGHAAHDASNILDGDYGGTGNTGLNAWNSGTYSGWVQVDFGAAYVLDRIELYGWYNTYDPFTLSVSADGLSWTTVAIDGYHPESRLTETDIYGLKYGAVYDVADNTLASGLSAQYVRYTVNAGSPHWGYMFEMDVQGHTAPVPEPETYAMLLAGLGLVGMKLRRRAV